MNYKQPSSSALIRSLFSTGPTPAVPEKSAATIHALRFRSQVQAMLGGIRLRFRELQRLDCYDAIGLTERNRWNRAKSPSVEQSVRPCSIANAAR